MTTGKLRRIGCVTVAIVGLLAAWVGQTKAYERYDQGCNDCHGSFRGGTSPMGTTFPENDKHEMHRGSSHMDTECRMCHQSGSYDPVYLGSSGGVSGIPGYGCNGCHGRDYGGSIGVSGVGLRAHHTQAGISECNDCHSGDPTPLPESVSPPYYGTWGTRVDDPCNSGPDYLESWSIGDNLGSDNDGDGVYDQDDSDCGSGGPVLGDMNCDGVLDMSDIALFVQALVDPAAFPAGCEILNGDFDGSGVVNGVDMQGFVSALVG